jgi:hypothetical protein
MKVLPMFKDEDKQMSFAQKGEQVPYLALETRTTSSLVSYHATSVHHVCLM